MRYVFVTPGTGSFYCGVCMRDNALVKALRRRGHDAMMLPMYLPTQTDEESAVSSGGRIFFGGVNAYLQQVSPVFRVLPQWMMRMLDHPVLLKWVAKLAGSTDASSLGEMTVSMLQGREGRQATLLEELVAWLREAKVDVVFLSTALQAGMVEAIQKGSGAKVVMFLQGEDEFINGLEDGYRELCWKLMAKGCEQAELVLAPSRYFAGVMVREMKLEEGRVQVLHNGISLEGYDQEEHFEYEEKAGAPVIGFLSRMIRSKGLEVLVEAFLLIKKSGRHADVKLAIAGTTTKEDEELISILQERIEKGGWGKDVSFQRNISREEKLAFLRGLTVFSVPAIYSEAFGLYVLEAMASGVPVVEPERSAFPEILEMTGGGVLCRGDNAKALADAILELLDDRKRLHELGRRGKQSVFEKFSIDRMAENLDELLAQSLF